MLNVSIRFDTEETNNLTKKHFKECFNVLPAILDVRIEF
jgi:hypothetical protein